MDAGSHDRLIANNVPVVLSCDDCFLKPTRPSTLFLSLDDPAKTAAFRVCVPFRPLAAPLLEPYEGNSPTNRRIDHSLTEFFALVDPCHIRHIEIESYVGVPEPVRQSTIAMGTSHGVLSLRIQLDRSPTIIGPASISRLRPTGPTEGNLLACLRVVSTARALTVFVAKNDVRMAQLSALCKKLPDTTLQASPREHALGTLYGNQGGKDIGQLLTPFTLRSSGPTASEGEDAAGPSVPPPAYPHEQSESSSATPASTSNRRSAEKRPASSSNSAAPSPKRIPPDDASPPSSNELPQLRAEVFHLRAEVARLAQQLEAQQADIAPTAAATAAATATAIMANPRSLDALLPKLRDALLPDLTAALRLPAGQQQQQGSEQTRPMVQEQRQQRRQQQQQAGGGARHTSLIQQVQADPELILRQLLRWKGVCLVCEVMGLDSQHSVSDCATKQGRQANADMCDMLHAIKFDKFSGCFECGVPQAICNRWERRGWNSYRKKEHGECQFKDVMAGVLYGIKHGYPETWEAWRARLEGLEAVRAASDGQVFSYLGRKWKEDGFESNRLVQEFLWLAGRLEDDVGPGDPLRGC